MASCGYLRVSARGQNEARQRIALEAFGVERSYTDKLSGKGFNRPEYQALPEGLKPGDALAVESVERMGRNYEEILERRGGPAAGREPQIVPEMGAGRRAIG